MHISQLRIALALFALPSLALAQVAPSKSKQDSIARADSVARADSIALVKQLEKELGAQGSDTSAAAASQGPRATGGYMNIGFVALTDAGWSSASDIGSIERGDHDPKVNGFTIPNAEISLDGAVDPYFKGFSNIVLKIDSAGETGIELEEAYALTTALPANLQVKFGQFFTEFGRQNAQHPHAWSFVDAPLALVRMFGPDGLRSQGVRISWLLPTPFYTEAMFTVANATGGTTSSFRSPDSPEIHGGVVDDKQVKGFSDLLAVPRINTSFDLTETQTVVLGASAAFGPNNSGPDAKTRIYGADLYWKWKPAAAQVGFPFLSLQTEALWRHYDAAQRISAENPLITLPSEVLQDNGAYAQVLWGIKPRIVAGLRGEFANGNQSSFATEVRGDQYRWSPNLTWYPTEFSKFRVQYNYDNRKAIGTDNSLWFQFEFLIGAHAAHKF
ncbi:MAG: hypothetical protein ACJ8AJ_05290 [Gemmatimonadaceae bacterium]